jgi:hypothetical protein
MRDTFSRLFVDVITTTKWSFPCGRDLDASFELHARQRNGSIT